MAMAWKGTDNETYDNSAADDNYGPINVKEDGYVVYCSGGWLLQAFLHFPHFSDLWYVFWKVCPGFEGHSVLSATSESGGSSRQVQENFVLCAGRCRMKRDALQLEGSVGVVKIKNLSAIREMSNKHYLEEEDVRATWVTRLFGAVRQLGRHTRRRIVTHKEGPPTSTKYGLA
ncbi:hypothetical protein BCR34DRAFT_145335 [Clohesyomyces aquaticus]|uniref:Uncharacterized protein n=1 Tax=Clohesyomyces aquaticus TaxID=1231657 RepID=A0A1Y2A0I4_9PLEO|nr:hypothetical protein BCR34DRAFT_145335 [Clohesyomyces aquaticus]